MEHQNPNKDCLYRKKGGIAPRTERELFEETIRCVNRYCSQVQSNTEQTDALPAFILVNFDDLGQFYQK
ncbi:hypothetical protein TcasGA2_TC014071 [Tribolium castaneum]|uniref:Uncharacterized protein n=1 Tax=Tribolium castaneum TaxID=7070 RepID=D6WK11_TRICA|nr:hypothetical protein TcasGA2_TC014071 [Tribolium castaneum]